MDIRIQQQLQRHRLLNVHRPQAPGLLLHQRFRLVVAQRDHAALDTENAADEAVLIEYVLVGIHFLAEDIAHHQAVGQPVQGFRAHLLGVHLGDLIPERTGHFEVAARELLDVRHQLVVVVVLRIDAAGARLEAHVDVLCHQHVAGVRVGHLHGHHVIDDAVVVEVVGQRGAAGAAARHQHGERALGVVAPADGDARFHFRRRRLAQHPVDLANGGAAIRGGVRLAGFQAVQFLQYGHRNRHPVLFEIKQRVGIVDQNIGIKNVGFRSGIGLPKALVG